MNSTSEQQRCSVKGILITASNCSGKSYLLKRIARSKKFSQTYVFEMDSLKCFKEDHLQRKLPVAWRAFEEWYATLENTAQLKELRSNIKCSPENIQLIKLTYIELVRQPRQVITVLHHGLRSNQDGFRFFELLEDHFHCQMAHVVIIPSLPRYILNLHLRRKLFVSQYRKKNLRQRKKLISQQQHFDHVAHIPLFPTRMDVTMKAIKELLNAPASAIKKRGSYRHHE